MTADARQAQSRKPADGRPSAAVAPARLRRLNRWLVEGVREDLADLYTESRATAPGDPYPGPGRRNFLKRLTTNMHRPGFALVIAETDRLMGCAFGFPVRADGSWWSGLDRTLPPGIDQLTLSGGVFAFGDILIRPHAQDRSLARRVQERLLTDHQASLGATLVDRTDHPALAAVRSWGWLDVGELRRPAGPTTFRALVLPVGEQSAARLEGLVEMPGGGGPGGA
ncbi:hypothetical protein GCM10023084_64540 [Streptomyces lacrimifluminis]|uniref:Uncharacterized protein n=1 Tax=Streptomyces lacrimifluminis TaxID=1500077 RepID=A0A917LBG8_9ACTN|nr:hypothetical protein [Streptomyces lacrimifluminis]GGJ58471.1 hypothetical protein GCM10012282_64810 [Streptomyces lacrimifluminis]